MIFDIAPLSPIMFKSALRRKVNGQMFMVYTVK